MKIFFLVLLIIASNKVLAESFYKKPLCPNLKNIDLFLIEEKVDCPTINKFEDLFYKLKLEFELPSSFPHVFFKIQSYEAWSTFGNLMLLNQTQISWGHEQTTSQRNMVWEHEIGHLIFDEMISRDIPEINCFKNYMEEDAKLKWDNFDPNLNTDQKLSNLWRSDCTKLRNFQIIYSELFADFIVALFNNDLDAPKKYMENNNAPINQKEKFKLYSFNTMIDLKSCENQDPEFFWIVDQWT